MSERYEPERGFGEGGMRFAPHGSASPPPLPPPLPSSSFLPRPAGSGMSIDRAIMQAAWTLTRDIAVCIEQQMLTHKSISSSAVAPASLLTPSTPASGKPFAAVPYVSCFANAIPPSPPDFPMDTAFTEDDPLLLSSTTMLTSQHDIKCSATTNKDSCGGCTATLTAATTTGKVKKKRQRRHALNNRQGKIHLDPSLSVKSIRKTLSSVEDLPASADLEIPPFIIPDGDVPDEPSPAAAAATGGYDTFTLHQYSKYHDDVTKRKKKAYTIRSVMSDTFYIHLVKALLDSKHLNECSLSTTNRPMHAALKARLSRNARLILFRAITLHRDANGAEERRSVPVLYVVKPARSLCASPTADDCVRVIPISQLRLLLTETHTTLLHRVTAIYPHLQSLYANVPRRVCEEFDKYCLQCNAKKAHSTRHRPITPIVSRAPRERYVIDFIDMRNDSDKVDHDGEYKWILHMIDHLSKYRWARQCKSKHAMVVMAIVREWWCEWGRPDILHSDNGGEFTADLVADLCLEWGVQKRHGRPYRPQTQGVIERANRQLKAYLAAWRANSKNNGRGWVAALPEITRAANHSYTRAIGCTPYDAFPPTESSRTLPGKGKLDLSDREDTALESQAAQIEIDDDDTRKVMLDVLDGVEGKDEIMKQILEDDRQAAAVSAAVTDVLASTSALPVASFTTACDVTLSHAHHPTVTDQPIAAATAAMDISTDHSAADALASGNSSDIEDDNDNMWADLGDEIMMFTSLQEEPIPNDPRRPFQHLHIIECGVVEPLWFDAWVKVSECLSRCVRVVGVEALGNCGPAAACSARMELHLDNRVATRTELQQSRASVLKWVTNNQAEYAALNKGRVCDVDRLLSQCRGDGVHVYTDFFRAYAWLHKLNVFLFAISATVWDSKKDNHGKPVIETSFSCRLFNTIDNGADLVYSPQPNTIAIHFHHTKSAGDKEGVGHYEYLIDSNGHSLWAINDVIVTKCLLPACEQCTSHRRLEHYKERMIKQETDREHGLLFDVGMLANLQVRREVRAAVAEGAHLHQNMIVRLLEHKSPQRLPKVFTVLTHAGVLTETVRSYELSVCGQDVDEGLRTRVVTADDESKRVSLLSAWRFEVGRALAAVTAGMTVTTAVSDDDMPSLTRTTRATTAARRQARQPRESYTQPTPSSTGGSSSLTQTVSTKQICGSCGKQFTLPAGTAVSRCMGTCQQTLHTLSEQCSKSTYWVQVPGGRACSSACYRLFR